MKDKKMRDVALVLCVAAVGACSGGNTASGLAKPPEYAPDGQTKCKVKASQTKPLIVEWPSADRAELESRVKSRTVVVVSYDGCEMRLLSHCRAPGGYQYQALTAKQDTVTITNEDELYASIPIYAAKFEGKLATSGQLTVAMTMVGRYETDRIDVSPSDLQGRCDGATHIIAGLTAGAFEFFAGADAEVGAGVHVMDAGVGAKSRAKRDTLTRDGDEQACAEAGTDDATPPGGCGALLRVEVLPLTEPKAVAGPTPTTTSAGRGPGKTSTPTGMVLVPAGSFQMGCAPSEPECLKDAQPRHAVHLDAFYIDKTEVSVGQYRACVNAGRCTTDHLGDWNGPGPGKFEATATCNWGKPGRDRHPINCVDPSQAEAFCRWGDKRLPTEAEWEKAARGTDGRVYPWGAAAPAHHLCWRRPSEGTCEVGSHPAGASPYGALDMSGSVSEFVRDLYSPRYYANSPTRNPTGPTSSGTRVKRGGAWPSGETKFQRVWFRDRVRPDSRGPTYGFRCAKNP